MKQKKFILLSLAIGFFSGLFFGFIDNLIQGEAFEAKNYILPLIYGTLIGLVVIVATTKSIKKISSDLISVNKLYQDLVENVKDIVFSINSAGIITYISPSIKRITGFSSLQFLNQPITVMVYPDDLDTFAGSLYRSLEGHHSPLTYRLSTRDGGYVWVKSNSNATTDDKGNITGLQGVMVNITEEVDHQKKLERSEANMKTIFNVSFNMNIITSINGTILEGNESLTSTTGFSHEEILNNHLSLILSPKSDIDPAQLISSLKNYQVFYTETYLMKKDKTDIAVELACKEIEYNCDRAILFMFRDLTIKNELVNEKEKLKRFKTIELLAGGISHDFNNLLMAVTGNITLCKNSTSLDSKCTDLLNDAYHSAEKMAELTKQIQLFSQYSKVVPQPISVENLFKTFQTSYSEDEIRRLDIQVNEIPSTLYMDLSMVLTVLHNLVDNALESSDDETMVEIIFSQKTISRDSSLPLQQGVFFTVSVKDFGKGIPDDIIDSIFDPFFTTRAERSGLGLATSYAFIKQHQGHISVSSSPNEGTIFTIYLPVSTK